MNTLDIREWQNSDVSSKIGEFTKETRDGRFDIVLTNPPFSGRITGKSKLSAYDLYELAVTGYLSEENEDVIEASNGVDIEPRRKRKVTGMKRDILFLERCLDFLKPGGRMGIVLPQGNLNNLGTQTLRKYISNRARLLAIVGLNINTFKPFTNTKTSMLFLQKWNEETDEQKKDYQIFMATSVKSGKANSGKYIYKILNEHIIDEDGVPITQSGKPPEIDHDLDQIAESFLTWGKKQGFGFLHD